MGVSTTAILFYGIAYDDDERPAHADADQDHYPWDTDEYDSDFEAWYTDIVGGIPYPPNGAGTAAMDDYFARRRDFIATVPVALNRHCSYEYPMLYLAIKAVGWTAYRGHPKRIDVGQLAKQPEWDDQIKVVCEQAGLVYYEAGWHLVSYWW